MFYARRVCLNAPLPICLQVPSWGADSSSSCTSSLASVPASRSSCFCGRIQGTLALAWVEALTDRHSIAEDHWWGWGSEVTLALRNLLGLQNK